MTQSLNINCDFRGAHGGRCSNIGLIPIDRGHPRGIEIFCVPHADVIKELDARANLPVPEV